MGAWLEAGMNAGSAVTPILNPGEAAILAFGAIRRTPWVVAGADGELGSKLLADVAALLNDPGTAFLWA